MNWSVYKYVQNYFKNNFPEWYLMNSDQRKGCSKFVNELLETGAKISDIKNGLYDNELSLKLDEYINNYFTLNERRDCLRLYEYIYEVSNDTDNVNFKVKYNNNIIDHIIKMVMVELFSQYHLSRLGTSDFEQIVISKYKEKYEEKMVEVYNKIKSYMERNLEFNVIIKNNIDMNNLINYVTSQILSKNDYEFVLSVINMKSDDSKNRSDIEDIINKYKNEYIVLNSKESSIEKSSSQEEKVETYKFVDVSSYISKVILEYYDGVNDQLLNSCTRVVESRLINRGYTDNQIVSPNMKNIVVNFIDDFFVNREARIEASKNSVKYNNVPSKIKTKRNKRFMNTSIVTMLLFASLIGLAGNGIYQMTTEFRDFKAKQNIAMIDDHYYANINTIFADSFEPTSDNIINTFDEYGKFDNDNFQYLGFYQAYRSVKQDRLYIMDNMLAEIRKDVRNNSSYKKIYGSIMHNGCYLDFMYDRLYEMGFEEIKDDKYQNLLDDYVELKNKHPYENVVKYLSPSQERLLEKIRDKYVELSEEQLVQLGQLLGSDEYENSVSNGRSL